MQRLDLAAVAGPSQLAKTTLPRKAGITTQRKGKRKYKHSSASSPILIVCVDDPNEKLPEPTEANDKFHISVFNRTYKQVGYGTLRMFKVVVQPRQLLQLILGQIVTAKTQECPRSPKHQSCPAGNKTVGATVMCDQQARHEACIVVACGFLRVFGSAARCTPSP